MNHKQKNKNSYMLSGSLARRGFMRWFHSFTGVKKDSGEKRRFFIEYLIMNPSLGKEHPILGQYPFYKKRGMKPSYVLVKAGAFPDSDGQDGIQLNAFYPISSLKTADAPFVLQIDECFYSENSISGFVSVTDKEARHKSFMTDPGNMEWKLSVHKSLSCDMGFVTSPFCTALGVLSSFWHAEGLQTFYKGTVCLNNDIYEVEPSGCRGYADKNWGKSTNDPLLLITSSNLKSEKNEKESKHTALAISGCFPRFLFIPLKRRLMIQLTYMGENFKFNFADRKNPSICKWKTKETKKRNIWQIKAQNKDAIIKISLNCTKDSFMKLLYERPDGTLPKNPVLGSGEGMGTLEIYKKMSGALVLEDTLKIEDALCLYQQTTQL